MYVYYCKYMSTLKIFLTISSILDVAGGPFGIEPSIRAAGNYYAIIGQF